MTTKRRHKIAYVVNMARPGTDLYGVGQLACSSDAWDLLLEIGKTFGWKALGASYVPTDVEMTLNGVTRHDYQPGDRQDSKLVNTADALAWATALSEAHASLHLAEMIGDSPPISTRHETDGAEDTRVINVSFATTMDEFMAFAYGGEFTFFRS